MDYLPKKIQRFVLLGLFAFATAIAVAAIAPTTPAATLVDNGGSTSIIQRTASNRATDWLSEGRQFYAAGRYTDAIAAWQAAADAFASRNDWPQQALSLSYLSLAYQEMGQWPAAQAAIEQSLALLEQSSSTVDAILWAQTLNTQAGLQYALGQPETALTTWEQAQTYYEQAGDDLGSLGSQINQAQALQSLGFYRRSRTLLETINQQLAAMPDSEVKIAGLRSLGMALQVVGDSRQSYDVLAQSLAIAQEIGSSAEIGASLLSIGKLASDLNFVETALAYFESAEATAVSPLDQLQAQLGRLDLYIQQNQVQAAANLAPQLYQKLKTLSPSRISIYSTVNFVYQINQLSAAQRPVNMRDLNQLLDSAVQSAQALKDTRAEAYALQTLGELYVANQQWGNASDITQHALNLARSIQAQDVISQSAWQLGRVYKQQGKTKDAIAAYTEAVEALQSLRGDLVAISQDVQFSYRDSVEPIYREFAALLLDGNPSQEALSQTRTVIEALQLAELDNFFQEACMDAQTNQIDQIDPNATVIYSIILPDRLAVILSKDKQPLEYHSVSISQADVESTLRQFLAALHPSADKQVRLRYAKQVYDWLIRPQAQKTILTDSQTLVFVLDGMLRNIPMAVLYDGEHYLIESHPVALSPGLQLLKSRSLDPQNIKALVGGISEARGQFSALPAVETEVNTISQLVSSSTLLNQQFTSDAVSSIIKTSPIEVVHLATHGQFSSDFENTFFLTWEGTININELSEMLQRRESEHNQPIELLVLSACETASGDDRATLGLAGLSVRSGARSTLATLWPIKDNVAANLMSDFYRHLQEPNATKASALQQAQLDLIHNPDLNDPFFWAAYVLVGNWL